METLGSERSGSDERKVAEEEVAGQSRGSKQRSRRRIGSALLVLISVTIFTSPIRHLILAAHRATNLLIRTL